MDSARACLYDLADELFRLAPWNWMRETQLIGVCHPDTRELAHVSIMGASGNHFCLTLYLGAESLHRFNLIQEAEFEGIQLAEEDKIALILESRQLQASFTPRDELSPSERGEIKALGRKYRGSNWPSFRSFRTGWAPKPIEGDEERAWLTTAIEQTLAVAPTLDGDPFGDYRSRKGGGMEHIARERAENGEWRTFWTPCDEDLFQFPRPEPGEFFVARVAAIPASQAPVECQFQLMPFPVGPKDRATFPYLIASMDKDSGQVLGMEALSVETQTHEDLIRSVPDRFLQQWANHRVRPASIHVATESTRSILEKTALALGIPIQRKDHLSGLDDVMSQVLMLMQGGA